MNTTLVIMAAGTGSIFNGGIKQLVAAQPSGEIIMDYSIHDALKAGIKGVYEEELFGWARHPQFTQMLSWDMDVQGDESNVFRN